MAKESPTIKMPEHRIFNIIEILEAILHELPQWDLLLSQAVCKTWRATVQKSTKLQRALFFVAESDDRLIIGKDGTIYEDPGLGMPTTSIRSPSPNVLIKGLIENIYWGEIDFLPCGAPSLVKRYASSEGSWKAMLLTRPALSSLYIYMTWVPTRNGREIHSHSKITNSHGVTIGDCIAALGAAAREYGEHYEVWARLSIGKLWPVFMYTRPGEKFPHATSVEMDEWQ